MVDDTSNIKKRQQIETEYHNKHAKEGENTTSNIYDSGIQKTAYKRIMELLGDFQGKRILDFGCGSYGMCINLAKQGAITDGFDISEEFIMQGNERVRKKGLVGKVTLRVMAAEAIDYPDNTFDFVIGSSILHHIDLHIASKEIFRVLKKGGRAIFMEPLRYNLFINIYRHFTPHHRTSTEVPLNFQDIDIFRKIFTQVDHEELYFFAILSIPVWKLTKNKTLFNLVCNILMKMDRLFFNFFPFLRKFCWITVLDMKK